VGGRRWPFLMGVRATEIDAICAVLVMVVGPWKGAVVNGDSKEVRERQGPAVEPVRAEIPGFVPFNGSVDESLVDAMLEMKISDRLRTLSRYVDAVTEFRTV